MQKVITKYGLAAHLAFLAVAPLFLSSTATLWLSALTFAAVIMEPSRVGSEMLHDARRRVAKGLLRDPLLWVGLSLLAIAALRALNTGIALVYDAEVGKWSLSAPQLPILPGSAEGLGLGHFASACVCLVVVMGCRHALGRSARSAFAVLASFVAGVAVCVGLIPLRSSPEKLVQAMACPMTSPVYDGCAYGICCLLSVAALATVFERRWWKAFPLAVIGFCGSSLGLFFYAPPRTVVLFAGAAILMMVYGFVYLRIKVSRTADFRCLVVTGLTLAVSTMIAMTIVPESLLAEKVAPFLTGDFLPSELLSVRNVLSRISFEVWREHPWLGTGLGSFPIDMNIHAHSADWTVLSSLQLGPLNGFWLLLSERGVVGAFFLAVPLVLLLVTYAIRLVGGIRVLPHPLAWLMPILLLIAVGSMLVDSSFLSPQTIVPLLASFSISANSFAKENGRNAK